VISRLQRLPEFVLTPIGRHRVRRRLRKYVAWSLLSRAAALYRSTVVGRTRVAAVVGSVGKTTTAAAVSIALGRPPAGHNRNAWGAIALGMLAIRPCQRHAVLEVGIDAAGQMRQYAQVLQPDIVVITAIASEHHRTLGSLDDIQREKAQILSGLRGNGVVIVNGDDQRTLTMAATAKARVVTFGFGTDNDVRADEPVLDWPHGTFVRVELDGRTLALRVRLLGRVMMYPILAALAAAWIEGRPMEEVVRELEELAPQRGRMEPVELPNGAWLIRDDFKSTIETIDASLDLLAQVPGRRIVVIGDISEPVGSQGLLYRRIGGRLAKIASRVVIVSDRRSAQGYSSGAARAGMPRDAVVRVRDVSAAVDALRTDLRAGDVVLIKGRDRQHLARVALALQGRKVGCRITDCTIGGLTCETCPMLERGWADREGRARA
jgi:UDP-N-acetylmuramoyl-tripeptide--D-alanyl-D-alanine ligase